jgi:hypothetical protein
MKNEKDMPMAMDKRVDLAILSGIMAAKGAVLSNRSYSTDKEYEKMKKGGKWALPIVWEKGIPS